MKVYKSKARKDIYTNGLKISKDNKKGYIIDRTKPKDSNDTVLVKKGETYYYWTFYKGVKNISLKYPEKKQLTRNEYELQLIEFQETRDNLYSDLENIVDNVVEYTEEVREYLEELQGRLDNMPEQLRESSILNERIESLTSHLDELDSIDLDLPDDEEESYELREQIADLVSQLSI